MSCRVPAALLLSGLAVANVVLGRAPAWLLWAYLGMSVLSAWSYWVDKRYAAAGQWRTAEATLHGIDLMGGIAGGLVAQHLFRHKTVKPGFGAVTALVAALHFTLNTAILAGLVALPG